MSFSGGTKATSATGWDPRKKPSTAVYLGGRHGRGAGSEDYENVIRANTEGRSTDFNPHEIDTYIAGGAGLETESYRTAGSPDYNYPVNGTYRDSINIQTANTS